MSRIRAAVLDWAGTVVDHGCFAPVAVFVELFRRRGVEVTVGEARGPMGTHKREHIRRMCVDPGVRARWVARNGTPPTDADIDAMYAEGEPLQIACLPDHADPIPGALDAIRDLRLRGLRIGSTTGYNRAMLDVLVRVAADRGYSPEVAVAASEVSEGRPAPYLNWTALMRLGVYPPAEAVAVGDTVVDVLAARNAGMWAVGVTLTGNAVGIDATTLAAMGPSDRADAHEAAARDLLAAGAHFVLPTLADLPGVVDVLDQRLAGGERP